MIFNQTLAISETTPVKNLPFSQSMFKVMTSVATMITLSTIVSIPVQAATLFSQTNIITNPGAGFNGSNVSQASASVNSGGSTATSGFRLAQSFTFSNPGVWSIDTVSVQGYMTSTYGFPPTSPLTGISVNIWDNAPGLAGSNIIGSTNTLLNTDWTGVYRTFNGVANLTNSQRPVMNITADFNGLNLSAGTYWVDYALTGLSPTAVTTAFSPYLMTVVNGLPNTVIGNARQFNPNTSTWANTNAGTPGQQVSFPLTVTADLTQIPEPSSTLVLLALGVFGAGSTIKRKLEEKD
jgi:hypothetical protein